MYCNSRRNGKRRAFTLVELMVVIVIIGLLAGATTMAVRSYLIAGKQSVAKMEIANVVQALETYYAAYDRYPTTNEGIAVLVEETSKFPDGLITKVPQDPWGNSYEYLQPGPDGPFLVSCYGADGREGGTGADRDITSDDLGSE